MKRSILLASLTAAILLIASPVFGQHGRPASPGAAGGLGATHGDASTHGSGNAGTNAGAKSPVDLLNNNTKLAGNLQNLLTKMGVSATPQQACANFTHLGPCVAAIHVAHNLKLDFLSLQCDMTLKTIPNGTTNPPPCPAGTGTGSKGMSLGGAIQTLDPHADAKTESKKATQQANADLKESNS
jgi:hypothetical protein